MNSLAAPASFRRAFVTEDLPVVNSDGVLQKEHAALVSRAAAFRIEADFLRERARTCAEGAIREQYLTLAQRWSMLAAGLEYEMMCRLPE